MTTTVAHVREPYDVYIGRAVPRRRLRGSKWANPFRIGTDGDRAEVLAKFRRWVTTDDEPRAVWIREHVHELRGTCLGCWCSPLACHGQILAEMADKEGKNG